MESIVELFRTWGPCGVGIAAVGMLATVGDPFKDTLGRSMNILIKLMSVVSLVIAPLL